MKRLLSVLVLLFYLQGSFAQQINTPYQFPVKPNTPQWKFNSPEEMFNKCQIPVDVMNNLTTEALAKTCLNYPLFGLMNAYNTPQAGFNAVRKNFNGIDALFERKDAGSVLINIYKSMNPENVDKSWPLLNRESSVNHFEI